MNLYSALRENTSNALIADPMAKAALANTFAFRVFLKFFFEKDCIKNIILTFQVKKNRVVEVH